MENDMEMAINASLQCFEEDKALALAINASLKYSEETNMMMAMAIEASLKERSSSSTAPHPPVSTFDTSLKDRSSSSIPHRPVSTSLRQSADNYKKMQQNVKDLLKTPPPRKRQ